MVPLSTNGVSRRRFLTGLGLGATALASGCMSGGRARIADSAVGPVYYSPEYGGNGYGPEEAYRGAPGGVPAEYVAMYGPIEDNGFLIPGIDFRRVDPRYFRQVVADPTGAAPGTITIDTASRFAYLSQGGGTAVRYGVGIGRDGFAWAGDANVQWKQKWPKWTPPSEMIARQPELEVYRDGMQAGLKNPLGARALYLFHDGQDTLYRLHGTPEYWTIGHAVSSGCVRFMNHDIIDLYDRVPTGAKVRVIQGGGIA
ncbi:L,D-transpeptidase [Aureimonas endophytica]|uniref:L,D-transpeptidase n=1 Tax=Aureimonas endophytica TaxID=2027858 RepID=A0A917EDZ3_9HYPH|nr:L,D-transpeptidase [Aureimonas endophytica]GGE24030.1 L,D-transpeptidase [Aureimonas endophytica]